MTEQLANGEQRRKIFAMCNEAGWAEDGRIAYLETHFNIDSSLKLTVSQASRMIEDLQASIDERAGMADESPPPEPQPEPPPELPDGTVRRDNGTTVVYDSNMPAVAPQTVLAVDRDPNEVIAEARNAALVLMEKIRSKEKPVVIQGRTYLEFGDWQVVGKFYGVSVKTVNTKYVEFGDVRGFESYVEAIHSATGAVVGAAEAMCLNDEPTWKSKPLFQLRSMAQTRAGSKALRMALGWVAELAGYASTPAEEMHDVKPGGYQNELPACPTCGTNEHVYQDRQDSDKFFCWKKRGGCGHSWKPAKIEIDGNDELLEELRDGLARASTIDDLKAAFDAVNQASKEKRLTIKEVADLKSTKNARKAILSTEDN